MGCMYSRLEEDELPSSPPRTRKGLPSTISCVAEPCLRRCGIEDGCATQMESSRNTNHEKTKNTKKPRKVRFQTGLRVLRFFVGCDNFCDLGKCFSAAERRGTASHLHRLNF